MDLTKHIINPKYGTKDLTKFKICTKLISRGVAGTSSDSYSNHPYANTSKYNKDDTVGISVNGNRCNRLRVDENEIKLAHQASIKMFVTDTKYHRNRPFNLGEREVAELLTKLGYLEIENTGHWILQII